MNENDYKVRLLKRVCEYLKNNYIEFKIHREDKGILFLYLDGQNKNEKASMIYDVFEAILLINNKNDTITCIDPCIKEKVIEQINVYWSESK